MADRCKFTKRDSSYVLGPYTISRPRMMRGFEREARGWFVKKRGGREFWQPSLNDAKQAVARKVGCSFGSDKLSLFYPSRPRRVRRKR